MSALWVYLALAPLVFLPPYLIGYSVGQRSKQAEDPS